MLKPSGTILPLLPSPTPTGIPPKWLTVDCLAHQRRAQLADTRCQHAHPTSPVDSAARPRLASLNVVLHPPNQPFLSMTPIECAYSLLPPSPPFLSTSSPVKTAPRRSTSAHIPSLSTPSPVEPATPWIDEGSGEPGRPRLPSPEAPSPPHLERAISSRPRPRQTPVERTTRAPAVYGRKLRV
ncbi:hypothetical protein DFH09DRAFT_1436935 [Mycena vulgaris]|nr:hypothetical protein DFH09DRAFT_1436935 [Mycena vulgaris]